MSFYFEHSPPYPHFKNLRKNLHPKFIAKHLRRSLFNKVACHQPENYLKKRPRYMCFPVNFGRTYAKPNTFTLLQAHWLKTPKCKFIKEYKFTAVEELITGKIDVCLISETKIGEVVPNQQFKGSVYS